MKSEPGAVATGHELNTNSSGSGYQRAFLSYALTPSLTVGLLHRLAPLLAIQEYDTTQLWYRFSFETIADD
jgi:hypothetical protein